MASATQRHIDKLKTDRRSPKNTNKYQTEIERFCDFAINRGVKSVHEITATLLDDYRQVRAKVLQPYTLHNHGIIIKGWLRFFKSRGLIEVNPLNDYVLKSVERPKHPAPTPSEMAAILRHATGTYRSILAMLAFTGLRVNECLHLQLDDVDLNRRIITVPRSKTAASARDVPIHDVLVPVLTAAVGKRAKGYLFSNPNPPRSEVNRGREMPWNDRTVLKQFKEIAADLGIETGTAVRGLTVYSLRRFFKSMAYEAFLPPLLIDTWLGHRLKGRIFTISAASRRTKRWPSCNSQCRPTVARKGRDRHMSQTPTI